MSLGIAGSALSQTDDTIQALKDSISGDHQGSILQNVLGKGDGTGKKSDSKLDNPETVQPKSDRENQSDEYKSKYQKTPDGRILRQRDEDPELRADDSVLIELNSLSDICTRYGGTGTSTNSTASGSAPNGGPATPSSASTLNSLNALSGSNGVGSIAGLSGTSAVGTVRDWLYVEDHCVAMALALKRGKPGEVYNVGGNSETTNIEIVKALCTLVDNALSSSADLRIAFPDLPAIQGKQAFDLITHVRNRPGHDRLYAINYTKAAKELGYAPTRNLATGLSDTLDWYLSNVGWWRPLLGRSYAAWVEKNTNAEAAAG